MNCENCFCSALPGPPVRVCLCTCHRGSFPVVAIPKPAEHPHQWLCTLASSLACLPLAPPPPRNGQDFADWLIEVASGAGKLSTTQVEAVAFLATLWNGRPEAFGLPAFNVACVARWDATHQAAFAAWAENPRTA